MDKKLSSVQQVIIGDSSCYFLIDLFLDLAWNFQKRCDSPVANLRKGVTFFYYFCHVNTPKVCYFEPHTLVFKDWILKTFIS
jgi:hypothetical protein